MNSERSEPALSKAKCVGGPGACPRRRITAGAGGWDITDGLTSRRLDGDRALHVVQRDLAGRDVDRRVVGGDPAFAAREPHAAAELEGAARDVDLERVGRRFDAFHARTHAAGAL